MTSWSILKLDLMFVCSCSVWCNHCSFFMYWNNTWRMLTASKKICIRFHQTASWTTWHGHDTLWHLDSVSKIGKFWAFLSSKDFFKVCFSCKFGLEQIFPTRETPGLTPPEKHANVRTWDIAFLVQLNRSWTMRLRSGSKLFRWEKRNGKFGMLCNGGCLNNCYLIMINWDKTPLASTDVEFQL